MPIRLVATDLDGTIVRRDGTISPRTIAAFDRVIKAGARVVLVTGRPPRTMSAIAGAFGNRGTALCSNGALTYNMAIGGITGEQQIPAAVMAMAARRLRDAIPGIGIAVEHGFTLDADRVYVGDAWDSDVGINRLADAALFGRPAAKLLGRHPAYSPDELLALARPVVDSLVNVYHSNGNSLIEMMAPGVSKATAVAALGIPPRDVIAFGDMPNDLPLLSWVGTSYAVANAHPDVLAAVRHITDGCEQDGVAAVLEQLFP